MNVQDGPVLIAYDGSPSAHCAVIDAAKLMRSCSILVVTVWEPGLAYASAPVPPDGISMTPLIEPDVARDVDRQVHDQADRISRAGAELARSLGLDAKPLAVADEGDVSRTLLRLADERQATAIVVGSRGLSGLRARLEGSTSKSLLKHARCPVLVVHEHEHPGELESTSD